MYKVKVMDYFEVSTLPAYVLWHSRNPFKRLIGIVGFMSEIGKEYLQTNQERDQTCSAMNIVGFCFVLGGSNC